MIKPTGFDGVDQASEGALKGIQGHIQPSALNALLSYWIPEFHMTILFENLFDDK